MRDPIEALLSAMSRDRGGIAIVWSPMDLGIRDWLVSQVESLAPERAPLVVNTVEAALAEPKRLALLVPSNEREAVEDLDASRDRIRSEESPRTQPILLFLFRDGDGQKALADAVSLQSLCGGSGPDPEELAEIDVEQERVEFQRETRQTPETWLRAWRNDTLVRTADSYALASRASLLERR